MSRQRSNGRAETKSARSSRVREFVPGLVSTVIPVFNRSKMLLEAVESVLAQTYRPIEIIIVDDGSTDDTAKTCDELVNARNGIVRVIHQSNAGPGVARQTGTDSARGEFIQYLDSDDRYLPEKTSLLVAALRIENSAWIAYGNAIAVHADGTRTSDTAHRSGEEHDFLIPTVLAGRIWHVNNPLYRANVFDLGVRWPAKRNWEDWEFDVICGLKKLRLVHVPVDVVEQRHTAGKRLGNAWRSDENIHVDRVRAVLDIVSLIENHSVPKDTLEMKIFARAVFHVARQAAEAGLTSEADQLLIKSLKITGSNQWDIAVYRLARKVVGWDIILRAGTVLGK
jgi:glycosyltransferase involved in cell wall biosynthesis